MVSINWPLVLLFLSVVCSAEKLKRGCKNFITTNKLVQHQEWNCLYPRGQLTLDGHFTLNQKIDANDLVVIIVASKFNLAKSKFEILWEVKFNFCNKLQWEGRFPGVKNYSNIPYTLCDKTYTLKKGKAYYVHNWPIDTRDRQKLPSGWYSTNVMIAVERKGTTEERKPLNIIFHEAAQRENMEYNKKKKNTIGIKVQYTRLNTTTTKKEAATYTAIDASNILFNMKFTHHEKNSTNLNDLDTYNINIPN